MTNKMWGGRFKSGPDAIMQEINASIGFDKRIYAQDIAGSKAHASMLGQQGIISKSDAAKLAAALIRFKPRSNRASSRFRQRLKIFT